MRRPGGAVGLVGSPSIEAGAVVLAHRVHRRRVVHRAAVVGVVSSPIRSGSGRVPRVGIGADHPLGRLAGLGEEVPVPPVGGEAASHARAPRRSAASRREPATRSGWSSAAGATRRRGRGRRRRTLVAERAHQRDAVERPSRASSTGRVGRRRRLGRPAVAAEVGADDRVRAASAARRDATSTCVRGWPCSSSIGRPEAAVAHAEGRVTDVDHLQREAFEHDASRDPSGALSNRLDPRAALLRELADPLRLRVVDRLANSGEASVSGLAAELGVPLPQLSNHLCCLREAGLVRVRRSGRHAVHALADPGLEALLPLLDRLTGRLAPPPAAPPDTPFARARTCYDHLAGALGVDLYAALCERDALRAATRRWRGPGAGGDAHVRRARRRSVRSGPRPAALRLRVPGCRPPRPAPRGRARRGARGRPWGVGLDPPGRRPCGGGHTRRAAGACAARSASGCPDRARRPCTPRGERPRGRILTDGGGRHPASRSPSTSSSTSSPTSSSSAACRATRSRPTARTCCSSARCLRPARGRRARGQRTATSPTSWPSSPRGGDGRPPVSPATLQRKVACLRSFHRHLRREELIDHDPTRRPRAPRESQRLPQVLNRGEVAKLLERRRDRAAALRDRALLELMYACGLRASEAIELDVGTST